MGGVFGRVMRKAGKVTTLHDKIDRRTLLQLVGAAGASLSAAACGTSAEELPGPAGVTFDETIQLSTVGPGGNRAWQPGEPAKFVPPERIPTRGKAASLLASQPKAKLHQLYERMLTSRYWERQLKEMALAGDTILPTPGHLSTGQEAAAVGVIGALNDDDFMAGTHRGHAQLHAKGGDLNKMSAEILHRATGYNKAFGGSMHITDISKHILGANGIVGASFYLAAGAGLHARARGTKQVAVAFYSDGAASSPYYFSAVRSSLNNKVPVLFVCENNFYADGGGPVGRSSPTKWISDYTRGLGLPHYLVDGNDITAVFAATHEAAAWARAGHGPSVIEAVTYRWYDHAGLAGAKAGQEGAFGLGYRTDEEVRLWMARDPIQRYREWLLAKELTTDAELGAIDKQVQAAVNASFESARHSPLPDPAAGLLYAYPGGPAAAEATQFYNRKNCEVTTLEPVPPAPRAKGPQKSYNYVQLEAVAHEMRANPDMVYYYEFPTPIAASPSGALLNLAKEFGEIRTSGEEWPIDESWIAGAAIGAAMAGSKAIARIPYMCPLFPAEYVFNQAGKLPAMTGGQAPMPFVFWVEGAHRRAASAAQHTDIGMEGFYAQMPGLKVVVPSNAYDAKGLLITAIRDPGAVVYVDYREVKSGAQPDVPDEAYEIPFGQAAVRQQGHDLTLVAWAPATMEVARALPTLAKAGVSVEYIDPRSLKPLDVETLAASVAKTRRLLVVEHGCYTNGFGAHVVAEVVQAVPGITAKRLAFPDVPGPSSAVMMDYLRPNAENIADAVLKMVRRHT